MRFDSLANELLLRRSVPVSQLPAQSLIGAQPPLSGRDVHATYGLLVHYTGSHWVNAMMNAGFVGRAGADCWLTPSPHAACMLPYTLGLDSPRDVCLLIDVSSVPGLWGPGTCPPSRRYPNIWRGGGIEFVCPASTPLPFALVQNIVQLEPCGDIF